jgi:hypothetical protein
VCVDGRTNRHSLLCPTPEALVSSSEAWPSRLEFSRALTFKFSIVLLACVLGASGCLRYGYVDGDKPRDKTADAGDRGPSPHASGTSGGGAGGVSGGGDGGVSGGGMGGRGGRGAPKDAGMLDAGEDHDAALPTDAGGVDDPDDAGAADGGEASELCPERPGLLFCDGFEDPTFARWSYNPVTNGTTTRSTMRKRTGLASLRATTGSAALGNEARWATKALANQKSGDLWLRFYNWLPGPVMVQTHFSVGVMSEIMEPYGGFSVLVRPNRVDMGSMRGFYEGTRVFPRDKWVCVELHVRIDPVDGVFEGYLDGVLAVSSGPTNTLPADGFTSAEVGIHYADANQGPVEIFVDDVVIAKTRVPCD